MKTIAAILALLFATNAYAGTVFGPSSSTSNAMCVWNGTSGSLVKNSSVTLSGTTMSNLLSLPDLTTIAGWTVQNLSTLGNPTFASVTATTFNGRVATAVQPTISTMAGLTSIQGQTITLLGALSVSSVAGVLNQSVATGASPTFGTVTATSLSGTLLTGSQPNITSVGTLSSLTSSGNVSGAALQLGGLDVLTAPGGNVTLSNINALDSITTATIQAAVTGTPSFTSLDIADTNSSTAPMLTVLNAGTGDASIKVGKSGSSHQWAFGYDQSADEFSLAYNAAGGTVLGTGTQLRVLPSGNAVLTGDLTVTGGDMTVAARAALSENGTGLTLQNVNTFDATTTTAIQNAVGTGGTGAFSSVTVTTATSGTTPQVSLVNNSTGDASYKAGRSGANNSYAFGYDRSADRFAVAFSAAGTPVLGTGDLLTLTSAGAGTFTSAVAAPTVTATTGTVTPQISTASGTLSIFPANGRTAQTSSQSGGVSEISVTNPSNTSNSDAAFRILNGGASGGNPYVSFSKTGIATWSAGQQVSTGDFVLTWFGIGGNGSLSDPVVHRFGTTGSYSTAGSISASSLSINPGDSTMANVVVGGTLFSNNLNTNGNGAITIGGANTGTITLGNSTNRPVVIPATLAVTGNTTLTGDIAVNGNDITSTGALTITPNSGSSLNVALATTGAFAVGTNKLYVDNSTTNVGIGTSTPGFPLDIQKSSSGGTVKANVKNTSTVNGSGAGLRLETTGVAGVAWTASWVETVVPGHIWAVGTHPGGAYNWYTEANTTGLFGNSTAKMSLDPNGFLTATNGFSANAYSATTPLLSSGGAYIGWNRGGTGVTAFANGRGGGGGGWEWVGYNNAGTPALETTALTLSQAGSLSVGTDVRLANSSTHGYYTTFGGGAGDGIEWDGTNLILKANNNPRISVQNSNTVAFYGNALSWPANGVTFDASGNQTFTINDSLSVAGTSAVSANVAAFAATIQNSGDNSNRAGLRIMAGTNGQSGTNDNRFITFASGNNSYDYGHITSVNGDLSILASNNNLHLVGDLYATGQLNMSQGKNIVWPSGASVIFDIGGTDTFLFDDNVTVSNTLRSNGAFFAALPNAASSGYACYNTSTNQLTTQSSATCGVSSERFKKNIHNTSMDSSGLYKIRAVDFDRKDGSTTNEFGVIAEEVVKIFPRIVAYDTDGMVRSVDYTKFGLLAVMELQKVATRIDDIWNELTRHDDELDDLRDRLMQLEARVATCEARQ